MDTKSPRYSAFAIVAIESVWPNPEGNEVPPDAYDLDLLNSGINEITSSGKARENVRVPMKESSKSLGYYKILPLNVTKVSTNSSVSGSNFSVSFTLDDLVLVTNEENGLLGASGLPLKNSDLVDLGDTNSLPVFLGSELRNNWDYQTDESLGLTRYKISGASSSFNIDDLIDANDHVTIWLYHEPSDFYTKNELPEVVNSDIRLSDDITSIIGSGDRRNQFFDKGSDFEEYALGEMGLSNKYEGENLDDLIEGDGPDQLPGLTKDEVLDSIRLFDNILTDNRYSNSYVDELTKNFFGDDINAGIIYQNLTRPYNDPTGYPSEISDDTLSRVIELTRRYNVSSETNISEKITSAKQKLFDSGSAYPDAISASEDEIDASANEYVNTKDKIAELEELQNLVSNNFSGSYENLVRSLGDNENRELQKNRLLSVADRLWSEEDKAFSAENVDIESLNISDIPYYDYYLAESGDSEEDVVNDLVVSLNAWKKGVEDKAKDKFIDTYKDKNLSLQTQNFSHGRKVLLNDFSGETPYLALKGKISSVDVSVGHEGTSYAVTLQGYGYEKTLNDHEVFYEDVFFPSTNPILAQIDYMTHYVFISPPAAMIDIINRYASRYLISGPPSQYNIGAQSLASLSVELDDSDDDDGASNEEVFEALATSEKTSIFGDEGNVILRGNVIYDDYLDKVSKENIRVFYPVNYIDTSRLREMVNVIELSHDEETQKVINTVKPMSGRVSVMDNLKSIGGAGEFYELFMDETGRIRYRLSFEAYERTPQPSISPIIQDDKVLSGASFYWEDSMVRTSVDLSPAVGSHAFTAVDAAFFGRSIPSPKEVPIQGLTDTLTGASEVNFSPDLFRHGIRTMHIDDVYTLPSEYAKTKVSLYRYFYENPLKKASISVPNDTSYRPGNTVLVSLQDVKHRSKTSIDIGKMIEWLSFLENDEELLDMYVGIDDRLLLKDSYAPTSGEYSPFYNEAYNEFLSGKKKFVLQQFLNTFNYLSGISNFITPEYFPPTWWFYNLYPSYSVPVEGGEVRAEEIRSFYGQVLRKAINNSGELNPEDVKKYVNYLKFHDFRAAQYYIEGVKHKFTYGNQAITDLSLNFGQDSLVLLDPEYLIPVGFISLEKKMGIGYPSKEQEVLYFSDESGEPTEEYSSLQKMYLNQYKEEKKFRKASVLYRGQQLKTSSTYMYELAMRQGVDTDFYGEESIDNQSAFFVDEDDRPDVSNPFFVDQDDRPEVSLPGVDYEDTSEDFVSTLSYRPYYNYVQDKLSEIRRTNPELYEVFPDFSEADLVNFSTGIQEEFPSYDPEENPVVPDMSFIVGIRLREFAYELLNGNIDEEIKEKYFSNVGIG